MFYRVRNVSSSTIYEICHCRGHPLKVRQNNQNRSQFLHYGRTEDWVTKTSKAKKNSAQRSSREKLLTGPFHVLW